jgi:hypothetical protein
MTTKTFEIKGLTVVAIDEHGEGTDLNAAGEPCRSADDLRAFVREMERQGFYDAATRDELLREVR